MSTPFNVSDEEKTVEPRHYDGRSTLTTPFIYSSLLQTFSESYHEPCIPELFTINNKNPKNTPNLIYPNTYILQVIS